jgi:hypothetical protein
VEVPGRTSRSPRLLLRSGARGPSLAAALVSLSAAGAALAQAPPDPSQRYPVWGNAVKTAVQLARRHWAMDACGGQVALAWGRLDSSVNAQSRWQNPRSSYGDPQLNTSCSLTLNTDAQFDWPKLCTILIHEYGHLTGHPHVDDPHDVMNPYYVGPAPECAATAEPRGAPSRFGGSVGGVAVAVACRPRPHRRPLHGLRACSVRPPRTAPARRAPARRAAGPATSSASP